MWWVGGTALSFLCNFLWPAILEEHQKFFLSSLFVFQLYCNTFVTEQVSKIDQYCCYYYYMDKMGHFILS